jgi:hypothetical protein
MRDHEIAAEALERLIAHVTEPKSVHLTISDGREPTAEEQHGWGECGRSFDFTIEGRGWSYRGTYRVGKGHGKPTGYLDPTDGYREKLVYQKPSRLDVVAAVLRDGADADQSFEGWCDTFGFSADSRRALATYLDCQEARDAMRRMFGDRYQEAVEFALDM